jgi:hypothetical protein
MILEVTKRDLTTQPQSPASEITQIWCPMTFSSVAMPKCCICVCVFAGHLDELGLQCYVVKENQMFQRKISPFSGFLFIIWHYPWKPNSSVLIFTTVRAWNLIHLLYLKTGRQSCNIKCAALATWNHIHNIVNFDKAINNIATIP